MLPHSGPCQCLLCQIRKELVNVWFCKGGEGEGGVGGGREGRGERERVNTQSLSRMSHYSLTE